MGLRDNWSQRFGRLIGNAVALDGADPLRSCVNLHFQHAGRHATEHPANSYYMILGASEALYLLFAVMPSFGSFMAVGVPWQETTEQS
jgi:hypothetical protein